MRKFLILPFLALAAASQASLTITLDNPSITVSPGDSFQTTGTIVATTDFVPAVLGDGVPEDDFNEGIHVFLGARKKPLPRYEGRLGLERKIAKV